MKDPRDRKPTGPSVDFTAGARVDCRVCGVRDLASSGLQQAGSPNGWDIFGAGWQPGAGSLSARIGNELVTPTAFSRITGDPRDVVRRHPANHAPCSGGDGNPEDYGSITVSVEAVPEPVTPALPCLAPAVLALARRRKPCT